MKLRKFELGPAGLGESIFLETALELVRDGQLKPACSNQGLEVGTPEVLAIG